ncbi:MAG: YdcF family protein, partial [Xanthobacteraceae bacterium]|nr:YdcF family protein [Xanthobacteraceae bacterium]
GDPGLFTRRGSEADVVPALFESLGVPPGRIMLESRSRNTAENAVYSKALAAPKPGERWLLVTSAMHMPRAIGAFREAGFPVEAYPVDYKTNGWQDLSGVIGSLSSGLRQTDTALHEWIGLVAYRLTGKSSALFPGPLPGPRPYRPPRQ